MLPLILIAGLAAAVPAAAPSPPVSASPRRAAKTPGARRVAIAELESGYQVDPKLTHTLSVLLSSELRRRPSLQVISQDDIRTLLGIERQRQMLHCGSISCLTEIAGALGAANVVAGSFSRVGDNFVLVVRVIDAVHARVLHEGSRRIRTNAQSRLPQVVAELAGDLFPDAPLPLQVLPADTLMEMGVETPVAPRHSVVPPLTLGVAGLVLAAIGTGLGVDAISASPQDMTYSAATKKNGEATAGVVCLSVGLVAGAAALTWGLLR